MSRSAASRFRDFTATERLEGFSFRGLFSDAFRRHNIGDLERMFAVGIPETIPDIREIDTSWPRPWMFLRALVASGLVYTLFVISWHLFENLNLLPGLIFTGSMAVPLSTVLFFFEANIRRNVSFYQVIRLLMLGGAVSLLFSLFLFASPLSVFDWIGAPFAAIVEEPGKLIALLVVARPSRYRYKLNGLLFGACIGAGFAIFESMGYAFRILLEADTICEVTNNIFIRGVLSPFGHIAWTAIAGAAIWRVKGSRPFKWLMIHESRFWHLFLVPVVLHMIWNLNIELPFYSKYIAIGFVSWMIVLSLVQEGLKELRLEKDLAEKNFPVTKVVAGINKQGEKHE